MCAPRDWHRFRRDGLLSILRGFVTKDSNSADRASHLARAPRLVGRTVRLRGVNGYQRFYASIAAGFAFVPATMRGVRTWTRPPLSSRLTLPPLSPPPARARPIASSNSSPRRLGTRTRAAPDRGRGRGRAQRRSGPAPRLGLGGGRKGHRVASAISTCPRPRSETFASWEFSFCCLDHFERLRQVLRVSDRLPPNRPSRAEQEETSIKRKADCSRHAVRLPKPERNDVGANSENGGGHSVPLASQPVSRPHRLLMFSSKINENLFVSLVLIRNQVQAAE